MKECEDRLCIDSIFTAELSDREQLMDINRASRAP